MNVVSKIGRQRRKPASRTAWNGPLPSMRLRLMRSMRISESFTTTPVRATTPNMLKKFSGISRKAFRKTWPHTAPTNPNGIALMTIIGCR